MSTIEDQVSFVEGFMQGYNALPKLLSGRIKGSPKELLRYIRGRAPPPEGITKKEWGALIKDAINVWAATKKGGKAPVPRSQLGAAGRQLLLQGLSGMHAKEEKEAAEAAKEAAEAADLAAELAAAARAANEEACLEIARGGDCNSYWLFEGRGRAGDFSMELHLGGDLRLCEQWMHAYSWNYNQECDSLETSGTGSWLKRGNTFVLTHGGERSIWVLVADRLECKSGSLGTWEKQYLEWGQLTRSEEVAVNPQDLKLQPSKKKGEGKKG